MFAYSTNRGIILTIEDGLSICLLQHFADFTQTLVLFLRDELVLLSSFNSFPLFINFEEKVSSHSLNSLYLYFECDVPQVDHF